ncbi:short-chain dehydrogenase [Cytobacillus massiliigabonensis]|uniref:short-chain dehydrogenase n=1 Tax=Cytobacillus massiliigabonensis TaxID=1871011 RepID=UPI000C81A8C2|nr:short-chain dehydrogenase [Cytobacillus massiliigabonensis]
MPCVHEFGIIDDFDSMKSYNDYTPYEYNCISVDDDIINSLSEQLAIMKTYFHSFKRPEFGLAYWGITIIPLESLTLFYNVVASSRSFKKSSELQELASKIIQATEGKKYMIHFGV